MRKLITLSITMLAITACMEPTPTIKQPAASIVSKDANTAIKGYYRVARRVEPVAESVCRQHHANRPASFCDFQIKVTNDPKQPPNAFQSIGRDGKPIISFNINMLKSIQSDHEIAFIMGHEAGHQIAKHLIQTRTNAAAGAILLGLIVGVAGGDVSVGVDIGSQIGGRAYSKKYELQADSIGSHIAARAGYNPAIGARSFDRIAGGSSSLLATHPPSAQRKQRVEQTYETIKKHRAMGIDSPIHW